MASDDSIFNHSISSNKQEDTDIGHHNHFDKPRQVTKPHLLCNANEKEHFKMLNNVPGLNGISKIG